MVVYEGIYHEASIPVQIQRSAEAEIQLQERLDYIGNLGASKVFTSEFWTEYQEMHHDQRAR